MIEAVPSPDKERLANALFQSYRWAVAGLVAAFVNVASNVQAEGIISGLLIIGVLLVGVLLATPVEYLIQGAEKKHD